MGSAFADLCLSLFEFGFFCVSNNVLIYFIFHHHTLLLELRIYWKEMGSNFLHSFLVHVCVCHSLTGQVKDNLRAFCLFLFQVGDRVFE